MKVFQRSSAEDEADRYNHTWAVILMLVLSLTTWLLPLAQIHRTGSVTDIRNVGNKPRYIPRCWYPAQFTASMQDYAGAACGDAFNRAINYADKQNETTISKKTDELSAKIYNATEFQSTEIIISKIAMNERSVDKKKQKLLKKVQARSEKMKFLNVQTPLVLFVLALCLKLSHIVWTLFSNCAGMGINHILESAKAAQYLDVGFRSQFKLDLFKAVSGKSTSFSSSLFYLLFKILTCVVTVVGLVIVCCSLLPQAKDIQSELDHKDGDLTLDNAEDYSYILICHLGVHQGASLYSYSLQCMFAPESTTYVRDATYSLDTPDQQLAVYLGLYQTMYTSLAVLLTVLSVMNITSVLIWVIKLVPGPFRKQAFSNTSLSMDVYLLLYMARQNLGPLTAKDLQEGLVTCRSNGKKTEEELTTLVG